MAQEKTPYEIETEGYRKGMNPLFGQFRRTFDFAPVSSGSKTGKKRFNTWVRNELADIQFVYYGKLKLEITLYLEEQKRLETAELADLDNCAKVICDSLKGPKGVMIDDSQIQSLSISWIDTNSQPRFEILVGAHPDDYIMKPVSLYEMPNQLFYPVSFNSWTEKGIVDTSQEQRWLLVAALFSMIDRGQDFKQKLEKNGFSPTKVYELSRGLKPILAGFPKGSVVESDFTLYTLKDFVDDTDFKKALASIKSRITRGPS